MTTFRGKAVTIACTDRARSERFYVEVLGALTLTLMPNASEPSPATFPDHAMPILWLEVDDLAAAHRHLIQRGVTIVDEDELFLQALDPDGLVVEVWQAEPLQPC